MTDFAFLLDSNICIYVLRDAECEAARQLQRCDVGTVAVSAISYAEVALGIPLANREGFSAFERFFQAIGIVPFDREAAMKYAGLAFRRGTFDRLIAAHALALDLTLVTNNPGDFADVPGLKVENWMR